MSGFYILLWPQTLIELSAATLKEKQFTAEVRQATLAPVCISRIDTARAKGVPHGNPWGGQMGGTTVPLQVIQYQRNSIYSMFKPVLPGGKRYPTHVHQQSSAGSAAAFCCGGKSSSFNVENRRRFTINRFFGFSLLCDRLHPPQYGSGANTERRPHTVCLHTRNAQCWTWPSMDVAALHNINGVPHNHLLLIYSCSKANLL